MKPTRRYFLKAALTGVAMLATARGTLAFAQEVAGGVKSNSAQGEMTKRTSWQIANVSGGTRMKVFVARPEGVTAKVPGVLVLQEIFGVNSYIRGVAQRIADLGYVVMAPDLFHRTAPGFESGYDDINPGMAEMKKMTDTTLELDLKAVYDLLTHDSQVDGAHIGSVGYCMGGRASFVANAVLPLQAAVVYYGGGIADTLLPRAKEQQAPLLIFSGGKDTHIGREKQNAIAAALKAAGKQYADIEFSEAEHGFFCDQRSSYNPEAAKESWEIFTEFFKEHLKA